MDRMQVILSASDLGPPALAGLFELLSAVLAAGIIATVSAVVKMRAKLNEVVWTLRDLVTQLGKVEDEQHTTGHDHDKRIGRLEEGVAGLRADVLHLAEVRQARAHG